MEHDKDVVGTMVIKHNWFTIQMDYVQAFPQAPVDRDLYMKVPKGFCVDGEKADDYILKLTRNVYSQRQLGWYGISTWSLAYARPGSSNRSLTSASSSVDESSTTPTI